MEESSSDWPLSIDQKCFDYLQIIRAWIKLSPLTFTFQHFKGHQTKEVAYKQLDWWGQRNEDIDEMAKDFLFSCTEGRIANRRPHIQPTLHLEKWTLARDCSKFTSICRDSLYTNLYGSRTLAYWAEKDDTPKDPKRILWEESRLVMKRLSRAQRRTDTKPLCNHCGFEKIKFNRKEQDTHTCPVCNCNVQQEDRNHIFACQAPSAVNNKGKGLKGLTKLMGNHNTSPDLKIMIIGCIRHVQNGTTPMARSVGYANFGSGITTRSIFEDQAGIGWTNFLCGRCGVKWKEAQKRHYLRMNKRKSAHLWVIAILKKLLLLRWDLWQFHNAALHSPTGATAITSHRSLNYKIDKNEIRRGRGCIDCSNYCVFSPPYTLTKLQSSSIHEKELWLYKVSLARKGCVEPDDAVTCQAIF